MSEPLRLLLGPGLDQGAPWRHRLADPGAEARAGWLATGPEGLVRQVALRAGLPSELAPGAERVAAASRALAEADDGTRSYSRSRSADPLGTARRLVELHDELRWAGWDGAPCPGSDLLADLASLRTAGLPAGDADLAHAALDAVRGGFDPGLAIERTTPTDELPPVVRTLLLALGDPPDDPAPPDAPAPMVILEAETPGEAAELVAAWLVDHPAERRTLLLQEEPGVLRAALRRRGLPGADAGEPSRHRPELQVLPLRLALAFGPQDPARALELLMLPVAPLPWPVRRGLIAALNAAPGIGGPAWQAALDELKDEPGVDRVERWFGGDLADPDAGLAAGAAAALCGHVITWASTRQLESAAAVASRLRRMLDARPPAELVPRLELLRMHDEAVGAGAAGVDAPAEAGGAAQCASPEAVLPGAQQVIWWGFVDTDAPPATPWTRAERQALSAAGASLPEPGQARRIEARAWRRALAAASDTVVLVRWRMSGGAACAPHPLMDALEVEHGRDELLRRTVTAEQALAGGGWGPEVRPRPVAAPPPGPAIWQATPGSLRRDRPESPSSIAALLNCPLAWTLRYPGGLRRGARASMPDGPRLAGTFMHGLLQDLLLQGDPPTDPDAAEREAVALFDARVAGEAAPLLAPGRGFDRQAARRAVGRAAGSLVRLLEAGGWRAVDAERSLDGPFAGGRWEGYADLILEREARPSAGVIDLKLGKSSNRRTELAEGRALQIALYAQGLATPGGPRPPAAYFTLTDGRTLTVDGAAFPGAVPVEGDDLGDTVASAERGWRWWRSVMDDGLVAARPWLDEDSAATITEAATGDPPDSGPPAADATCDWCDFRGICLTGRST